MQNLLIKKCFLEALGTFAIVFFGCGSVMVADRFPGSMPPGATALVFGLVVTAMVYTLGHLTGAHLNPAVTLGFVVGKHFERENALAYIVSQCLGGILASFFLGWLLPGATTYGASLPAVPTLQAVVWEFCLTFFLMLAVVSVATDTRAVGSMAGVVVGGVVALLALVGGPVTGASMNPARSLGPALFEGELPSLWIYWVGPILGAISATLLYEWAREPHALQD
jgi:aquaporin NIP